MTLTDLCKSSCIRILSRDTNNGYHNRYVLCNELNISLTSDFSIHPFNEWSDHSPFECNNTHDNNASDLNRTMISGNNFVLAML
jgi:hypothetical protein